MEILDFIKTHDNWEELLAQEPCYISTTRDGKYFLLKYDQIRSDFAISMVRECRGSIFKYENGEYQCVCLPFIKFGNYGESYVEPIDWDSACVLEKVDGSLIKLWYDNGWHWSTNGVIDAAKADLGNGDYETFYDLIADTVGDFGFVEALDKRNCYMFELATPYNKVVIKYSTNRLYLLAIRNMVTLEEYNREQVHQYYDFYFKDNPCFLLPKQYELSTLEDCLRVTASMGADEEGFVVSDKNFKRAKVKSNAWLVAAKLKNNGCITYQRVIRMMREGVVDDFIAYCPEHQNFVQKVVAQYTSLQSLLEDKITAYEQNGMFNMPRKEFAIKLASEPGIVKTVLFNKFSNADFSVTEFLNSLSENKLQQLLK